MPGLFLDYPSGCYQTRWTLTNDVFKCVPVYVAQKFLTCCFVSQSEYPSWTFWNSSKNSPPGCADERDIASWLRPRQEANTAPWQGLNSKRATSLQHLEVIGMYTAFHVWLVCATLDSLVQLVTRPRNTRLGRGAYKSWGLSWKWQQHKLKKSPHKVRINCHVQFAPKKIPRQGGLRTFFGYSLW